MRIGNLRRIEETTRITNSTRPAAPPIRTGPASFLQRSRAFASHGLWLIVVAVFLCAAVGAGLNTNLNHGDRITAVKATRLHDQDGGRIYNQAAIAVCMIGLLIALTRPGAFRRTLRVLKNPIGWAVAYQMIITWHFWSDDNAWDMARLCGVWLLLMLGMAASSPMTLDRFVPKMVLLFRLLLWISVVIGIVLPDNGWQHQFADTFLPGINERFVGVGGHPNGMGALAGIAFLLELDAFLGEGSKKWLGFIHLALAGTLLILTQSKTSLLACAVCAVYHLVGRRNRLLPGPVRVVAVATSVLLGGLIAWSYLADWVVSNQHNLGDLTGRLSLWQYLWNVGLDQPWFGYGKSLWAQLDMSESFHYKWAVGNAHNQLLDSFVMAGAVGVFCLIGYVVSLFRQRRHIDFQYRALFTACLVFLVIRSVAEAGFEPGNLGVVGHLQTVLIGFCLCRQAGQAPRRFPVLRPVWRRARAIAALDYRAVGRNPLFPARTRMPERGL